jgi:SET domain-containing protein
LKNKRFKPSDKIEVRASPGKGRGVFATRAVRRGEHLEVAPILLVPHADGAALARSFLGHYMFQTDDGERYAIGLGYASLINHDDDPNVEFFVSYDTITIRALRAIPKGAELTIDYGWTPAEWADVGIPASPGP